MKDCSCAGANVPNPCLGRGALANWTVIRFAERLSVLQLTGKNAHHCALKEVLIKIPWYEPWPGCEVNGKRAEGPHQCLGSP